MLNTAIEVVEHKAGSPAVLLVLKDFRQVSLEFPSAEEALDLADALRALSRPSEPLSLAGCRCFTCLSAQPSSPSCTPSSTSLPNPSLRPLLPGKSRLHGN